MSLVVTVNGEETTLDTTCSLEQLVQDQVDEDASHVAVAVDGDVIPRSRWSEVTVREGAEIDIVQPIQGGDASPPRTESRLRDHDQPLEIAGERFESRLIFGTGGYKNLEKMRRALLASGAEMATVGLRRINVEADQRAGLMEILKDAGVRILPNTAGCYTADDAVRTAQLGREALDTDWVKLEVIGDDETLLPDVVETLNAARRLIEDDFVVLPYTSDDPITAKKLESMGCPVVMPLASPIGSGRGIANPDNLQIIRESVEVPMIVDAGIGSAADAAQAMELGADGILSSSAMSGAEHPAMMAESLRKAVEAGRLSHLAGRIPRKLYARPSTSMEGRIRQ